MLYPFYEDDNIEIAYSDYENFDGISLVRIYAESFNEKREHFDKLEFYIPSYTITQCKGFNFEQVKKIYSLVKTCQEMIIKRAK